MHTPLPRIFIPSYPGYAYLRPGYSYPHTPDIHTLVPRIFIPSYPGYSYPHTPDIHTFVPRQVIRRPYLVDKACDCRDAFSKAIYGRLFGWVVAQINVLLAPGSSPSFPRSFPPSFPPSLPPLPPFPPSPPPPPLLSLSLSFSPLLRHH